MVKLVKWRRLTWPDSGCVYLVLLILRWPIQVDSLSPDRMYFYSFFCNMGNGCLRDTWSRVTSLPKQQIANDWMSQSVKVINCSSCPLCHVKEAFCCLLPPFVLGIKWKIRRSISSKISSVFTKTPSWYYYSVVSALLFLCIFVFFTYMVFLSRLVPDRRGTCAVGTRRQLSSNVFSFPV